MEITRQQILDALDLPWVKRCNAWVSDKDGWSIRPSPGRPEPDCFVCAVGSVIRSLGVPLHHISWIAPQLCEYDYAKIDPAEHGVDAVNDRVFFLLKRGNWAAALSVMFESCGLEAARELVNFHFPEKVTVRAQFLRDAGVKG